MAERSPYVQTISWLRDLEIRKLLNMEPSYQRRSVWTARFREDFIDTVLLDYPAPAIFLFEIVSEQGVTTYDIVDGKQRLTTIFDFLNGRFAVGDNSPFHELRGQYFETFSRDRKIAFYKYKFSVEVLPTNEEAIINSIFDRLNRNTMKLTPQELRHAKYDGKFLTASEDLAEWLDSQFDREFPKIATTARKQMKDVEIVATLLLYLEEGPKSYSTVALDKAFNDRDESWDGGEAFQQEFRFVIEVLRSISQHPDGQFIQTSRFKNQADFYSLFAAISELARTGRLPELAILIQRLRDFNSLLEYDIPPPKAVLYLEAARSASNDAGPRRARISVMCDALLGVDISASGAT